MSSDDCSDCNGTVEITPDGHTADRCESCRQEAYSIDRAEEETMSLPNTPDAPIWPLLFFLCLALFFAVLWAWVSLQ